MDQQNINFWNRLIKILVSLSFLVLIYSVASSVYYRLNTGKLMISSSPGAVISIYQPGKIVTTVGTSSAKIHLKPGEYTVAASYNRLQARKSIQIKKGDSQSISLYPTSSTKAAQTDKNKEANTLIKLLPYTGPSNKYVVSYTYTISQSSANPTIIITAAPADRQDAINWIKGLRLDPSKMSIVYYNPGE